MAYQSRNLARIQAEILALTEIFGPDSIYFSDDGSKIFVPSLVLPVVRNGATDLRYNRRTTPLAIDVPHGYGYGVPLSDVWVASSLRLVDGSMPTRLFDFYRSTNPLTLAAEVHYPGRIEALSYLCIHATADVTFDEYFEQINTYLSDPVG